MKKTLVIEVANGSKLEITMNTGFSDICTFKYSVAGSKKVSFASIHDGEWNVAPSMMTNIESSIENFLMPAYKFFEAEIKEFEKNNGGFKGIADAHIELLPSIYYPLAKDITSW